MYRIAVYRTAMYRTFLVSVLLTPGLATEKPPQMESKLDKQLLLRTGTQISFELNCQAKADPPAIYQWFRGDEELSKDTAGVELAGGRLVFSNPGLQHEGYYYCLASNQFGVAKSTVVHLTPKFENLSGEFVPPSFVRAPENEIKPFGGTAEFECRGEGEPAPEVTWYKNGRPMVGKTEDRLVIENIDMADVANYACNISNIAGYEYKDVYLSILRQPAKIKMGPKEEETVSKGSNVTIHCVAEGYPKPMISWAFNGKAISSEGKYAVDENNGDLMIRKVSAEDQGTYRCTASNEEDVDDVKEGNIIVKSVTTIVDGPRDSEHKLRSNITMNCTVMYDLSEELTVSWKKDNEDLQDLGGRIRMEENHALTINNLSMSDAGDYTCMASTSTSKDTDNGKLTILGIPPKLKILKDVEKMEGDDIVLECVVEEGYPKPTVAWNKDGDADGELENNRFKINDDNSLVIKNAVKEDSGVYICEATNANDIGEEGVDSIDVVVNVRRKTRIVSSAVSHLYEENQRVMIDCEVDVDSDLKQHLNVTWYHGKEELKLELKDLPAPVLSPTNDGNSELESEGQLEGSGNEPLDEVVEHRQLLPNDTLVINDLREEDLGEYRCEAIVDKPGLGRLIVSPLSEIYSYTPFPWWIILVVIIIILLIIILVCVICKVKKRRTAKGYYDVSDIGSTGKKHNKSDIYYVADDVDADSIMNESDNFLLNDNTPNKTPIFTPKTIRYLNNLESTTGSLGSLIEDDEYIMKGMDEDGSFRERYAE